MHTDHAKLFNRNNLENFYHFMRHEMEYKPSTIAEKLRRLKKAMDFLDHLNFKDIKQHQHSLKYKNLLTFTSWINLLSKHIALQRQERGRMLDSEVAHTISPLPFLDNEEVKRKVAIAKKISEQVFSTLVT